jgi:hypothetical protein
MASDTPRSALGPLGKAPDRYNKGEQEQRSRRDWRLMAADMVENCEQHHSRETGRGRRAEPRRSVDCHWHDDSDSTREFRETDERDKSAIQTRRPFFSDSALYFA